MKLRNNTPRTGKLNSTILKYFLVFSASLLVILWLLEIVFIDQFYHVIRTMEVKSISSEIVNLLASEDNSEKKLYDVSFHKDVSVVIISGNSEKRSLMVNDINLRQLLGNRFEQKLLTLEEYYNDADSSVVYINRDDEWDSIMLSKIEFSKSPGKQVKGIVSIRHLKYESGNAVLMVFGSISPLASTVSTLRMQLIVISAVLIIISVLISLIASRRIARPIENITKDAKIMATGDYDITFHGEGYREIEELSDTLSDTARQLKKADQVTKDLIANVSHDLRTPLTMISGYGEIMRDVPGENTPENVQVIIDEANRLTSLVNNMLDISKLQSGANEISVTVVNINELIQKICNTYTTMMEKHGYQFIMDVEKEDCYISGDPLRLEQVFYNLINNAIAHIGEDKKIIIKCHRTGEGKIRTDVIDHGTGIAEEDLPFIWQRYYKADRQNPRPETGSGLGLSIVKTILDLHHAVYGVESSLNNGSDFWFELPSAENGGTI